MSVYARIGTYYKDFDVDDTGVILIEWDNGVTSYVESGWWQPHADGPEASTQLYGLAGFGQVFPTRLELPNPQEMKIDVISNPAFIFPRQEHAPQEMYDAQMACFAGSILSGQTPVTGRPGRTGQLENYRGSLSIGSNRKSGGTMKITVIGGGSTYTPELVNGFLARHDSLPVDELWLMDINAERLEVVGGFAKRMVEAKGAPFKVVLSTNQREAVSGATYVTTQLRVGMMPARVADEYLGRRHGLIGQETTGIGGMAKALRTVPVVLNIAKDVRELAPGALLVNFTNPSGLVTEALQRFAPDVPSVGVCNSAITTKMGMLEGLKEALGEEIAPERAEIKTLGLNHLTWYHGLTIDGEDMWPKVIEMYLKELRADPDPGMGPAHD